MSKRRYDTSAASNLLEHGFMFECMENLVGKSRKTVSRHMENLSLNIWTCGNFGRKGSFNADYDGSPTFWTREWCSLRTRENSVTSTRMRRILEFWWTANFSGRVDFILLGVFGCME
ncbi:hypothetical protein RhiirA4_472377 [Rhizophagus irregularis]|uniref:Uncharacterized protein n=1 Tax=Rhizophagus irregularis TaxID=588596 RepID=A0A2I1H4U5_9GLOM|nr:hypothetical protein RhiirA4_472377 [Rhizophagus irregularis]